MDRRSEEESSLADSVNVGNNLFEISASVGRQTKKNHKKMKIKKINLRKKILSRSAR